MWLAELEQLRRGLKRMQLRISFISVRAVCAPCAMAEKKSLKYSFSSHFLGLADLNRPGNAACL